MKILVSAFACNPYQGSEPGVGWTTVCRIAREHHVFVLVDSHNKEGWRKGEKERIIPPNVEVRFLRKSSKYVHNKLIARLQSWHWFSEFNRLVLDAAREWHAEQNFDLCHQVTIATWRIPSPLWQLPIPFIWGPIGGAGRIPNNFRPMLSWQARLFEMLRDISTARALRTKAFRQCMKHSAVILAANQETLNFLMPFRGGKPLVRLSSFSLTSQKASIFRQPAKQAHPTGPLEIFAGGFMIGSKGLSLALKSLKKAADRGVDFHYTIAGGGPETKSLQRLTRKLGIQDKVTFHPGYSGDEYIKKLQDSEVFLLPSFREGTGITLIESCLSGCYPIVADISAQGEIVNMTDGIAIPLSSLESVIDDLCDAIIWCSENRSLISNEGVKISRELSNFYSSEKYDKLLFETYESVIHSSSFEAFSAPS